MASVLGKQLAVEQLDHDEFVSQECPSTFGNPGGLAYGGCTLGIATRAAHATAPEGYHLYSLVGQFLGPASTASPLSCSVERTRDTKTFATRRVVVSQPQPDGAMRPCLQVLADFHHEEPALLRYSAPPTRPYSGPDQSRGLHDLVTDAASRGLLRADPHSAAAAARSKFEACLEMRYCPEGMAGQNFMGMVASHPTDQDDLPVTERVSAEWVRTRAALTSAGEKAAAHAFLMDGLPFTVVAHNKLWLADIAASLTLDFALRVFVPEVDLTGWHLRERKTIAAGLGRAYSEARLWDEQGNLVACMTQQSILRPKAKTERPTKATL